ncbi:hypothetical protein BO78DRAFT_400379 [Aspergillus sclerotiicarbonarius CBS 121057]|uniref:O-methyltransferase n=1 Tax=Aspergillus sclerotiicarbonarius (strain CBS 121057 / IBT 28362) TaxID=1448318 RepID=A0A319E3A1_ASPSB|nr:hypothetical protein BO78DRAFT_400379 [Aspergillus sclerotiicarbonarius CBS 121057]
MDTYLDQYNPLMAIGPDKSPFITSLASSLKPSTLIELGGYVGYSAILYGECVRENDGKQHIGIE